MRKEGGSDDRQIPTAASSLDMETEQIELPMPIQNNTRPENTQPGHGSGSDKPSIKPSAVNPETGGKVSFSSPSPLFYNCDSEAWKISVVGNEACDESSIVGLTKHPPPEAHEISNPLKQTNKPSKNNETTTGSLSPKKGNWKRFARAQGKQGQNNKSETQSLVGLSGSKRSNRLVFSEESKGKPLKKQRDSLQDNTHNTTDRSAVTAMQHRREQ